MPHRSKNYTSNNDSITKHNESISKPMKADHHLYNPKTPKSSQQGRNTALTIPSRWTRHSHVSSAEHRINYVSPYMSGVTHDCTTPLAYAATEIYRRSVQRSRFVSTSSRIVRNRLLTSIRIKREGSSLVRRASEGWPRAKYEKSSSRCYGRGMIGPDSTANLDESSPILAQGKI